MNALRDKLKSGGFLKGMHVILNEPCITELVASLSYDFIWIDTEHSAIDYKALQMHLIAAHSGGTPAVVRVPWNDPVLVKRVLEQGPDGIVFPMIGTAEELDRAMASCLYPPEGSRGFGPIRAIRYNLDDANEYIRTGHKRLVRFIQIESETGVNNLEQMLNNPYVDGIILGPCDLSASIGEINDVFGAHTQALIRRAIEVAKQRRVPVGVSTGATDYETIKRWHDMGMDIISAGMDYDHVRRGATDVLSILNDVGNAART